MSALISGVTSKVRALVPNHDGRWDDAAVQSLIHLADLAIREEGQIEWATHEFDMIDGAYYYSLPTDVIEVRSVEFSRDGLVYEDWLKCVSLRDMDEISLTWQDDAGSTPTYFSLLSTPGTATYSKIMIYPKILSTSGQKIRVNYTKSRTAESDLSGQSLPDEVQDQVYVPYVLSLMQQHRDPALAKQYMDIYRDNMRRVRARYLHRPTESVHG